MLYSLTELIEKIRLGEDATIEFKREMPHRDSMADEIAAFANGEGGVFLIGVDDYSEIVGLELQELDSVEKTVVEICEDSIEPTVSIFTEKLRFDGKNLLKIAVSRSFFVHKSPNGYFTRKEKCKKEMSTEQLARLYSQATRNELLSRLLSEIALDDGDGRQVKRRHFLERRGEGVGIILNESEQLSGKTPIYELFNEELCLTIFAAKSLQEDNNYGKF